MIDMERANEIAESWLAEHGAALDQELAWSGEPSEYDLGWVFAWNSQRYVETGDFMTALMGNAPLVVLRDSGEVHLLPTGVDTEEGLRRLHTDLEP